MTLTGYPPNVKGIVTAPPAPSYAVIMATSGLHRFIINGSFKYSLHRLNADPNMIRLEI
jgi:hypothetical protein